MSKHICIYKLSLWSLTGDFTNHSLQLQLLLKLKIQASPKLILSRLLNLLILKLFSFKCLSEHPLCRCYIVRCDCFSTADCYLKRQRLVLKVDIAMPVLSPVPSHWYPPCSRPLHFHSNHFTIHTNIGNQHLIEVRTPTHCESHATTSFTLYSATNLNINNGVKCVLSLSTLNQIFWSEKRDPKTKFNLYH